MAEIEQLEVKENRHFDPRKSIINKLDFNISLESYDHQTDVVPKLKVKALLPKLSVNLTEELYKNILEIGDCFKK